MTGFNQKFWFQQNCCLPLMAHRRSSGRQSVNQDVAGMCLNRIGKAYSILTEWPSAFKAAIASVSLSSFTKT